MVLQATKCVMSIDHELLTSVALPPEGVPPVTVVRPASQTDRLALRGRSVRIEPAMHRDPGGSLKGDGKGLEPLHRLGRGEPLAALGQLPDPEVMVAEHRLRPPFAYQVPRSLRIGPFVEHIAQQDDAIGFGLSKQQTQLLRATVDITDKERSAQGLSRDCEAAGV